MINARFSSSVPVWFLEILVFFSEIIFCLGEIQKRFDSFMFLCLLDPYVVYLSELVKM